ncbi:bifunctional [glutamine synthetase] adenylyltransferase/[glutamine synthetase]-adenylyl-L-tyrosine phosphorylase [Dermacoccaceae bacterium W4C1]
MKPGAGEGSTAALARAGLVELSRAQGLLTEFGTPAGSEGAEALLRELSAAADPDQALLGLVRLAEALAPQERARMVQVVTGGQESARGVVSLLGGSTALTDHLVRHPEHLVEVEEAAIPSAQQVLQEMVADVRDRPESISGYDALRIAYRRQMLRIATVDLSGDAIELFPQVAGALADLAAAALEAALVVAHEEVSDADRCRLSVIGMGKCGGHELNYISDVDVIFVAEPAPGVPEDEALAIGTAVATAMMRACSASTPEGSLWQVDAALRPEGKNGPLVRTVDSHRVYYQRWAKTWEFQALLKARPVAGDAALGQEYLQVVEPLVWQASKRDGFVEDVQTMRRRVEQHVPAAEQPRQLKLGPGGLRDIEFSVQLLQLVHGRTDERIRYRSTLAALDALSRRGYVGRTDAHTLDDAYRQLRVLEHRIQLARMRRTHLMPVTEPELRRLGRSIGLRSQPEVEVTELWKALAREVRRMHERLFYRPLLSAVARLDDDDARLSPQEAQDRFAALGFADPVGAVRHVQALTSGVSRRAVMQRTLLPVMLQWFAQEADPDAGLLAFRKISESLGSSPWFLKQLRESTGAEQLARVLARSRYVANLLENSPSTVAMMADPQALVPRSRTALITAISAAAGRPERIEDGASAVHAARRAELARVAMADLLNGIGLDVVEQALTDIWAACVQALLDLAQRSVAHERERPVQCRISVIGMGRFGGREMGYASDGDLMYVYLPLEGASEPEAGQDALAIVNALSRLASAGGRPPFELDTALRPEGKAGPLVRSLEGYRGYYERWSEGWEAQALLRAAPVAGDAELGEQFLALIDPLRWPAGGMDAKAVRQIRTLKARMEAERIPRGGDRRTHVKLGAGGLSDVEWTVQLLQLQYAGQIPALRSPGTMTPLAAAQEAGLLDADQASALHDAWCFATRVRNASVLWRGRPVDSLPSDLRDCDGIGRILGYPAGSGMEFIEDYRRAARHARAVVDEVFYGEQR